MPEYQLRLEFGDTYPEDPPVVSISKSNSRLLKVNSKLDISILGEDWTPFFKVVNILENISAYVVEHVGSGEMYQDDEVEGVE